MRSDERAPLGLKLAAGAAIAFLHLPLLVVALYAFTTDKATLGFPPPGLTLQWFGVAWGRTDLWQAFRLSLGVAAVSTAMAI
ncbi:MAG TPA: ABC transporter permease, partial [Thermoanaerobaculia bacterium]|nr:ABC transporter permease [Thermoanaerobaculia bacterium]